MGKSLLLKGCALAVLAATLCGLGCAHTVTSESTRIRQAVWQAPLDECQEVLLSVSRVHDSENGESVGTYEQLTLELRPRRELEFEALLESVELSPGSRMGQLEYDDIEVRADKSRQRVWFVDVAERRVVATLDRDTRATTGPDDDPPPWATVDGGVLLRAGK